MQRLFSVFSFICILSLLFVSCKKDPEVDVIVKGCTDPTGDNYNKNAQEEDGSCTYQKRFISQYDINILCGAANAIFKDATLEITANPKKDRVNFKIGSIAGNIDFDGIITKSQVQIDTIIRDLIVNAKNINMAFPDVNAKADIYLKSLMTLSDDAKVLSGDMDVKMVTKDTITIGTLVFKPGYEVLDKCNFIGTKK